MLHWLRNKSRQALTARQLYGSSVAAARDPVFYRDWHVADTLEGRFEIVVLHVGLLVRRLTAEGEAGKRLGQAVLEEMFAAIDDDMRELGVGDMTVPKRVKAAASAFYGRLRVYDAALTKSDDAALGEAFKRNLPAGGPGSVSASQIARYARALADELQHQPFAKLNQGEISFRLGASHARKLSP